ncbi:hypothetical protein ARMGADRAFT_1062726 [Armillaria gallica]|uniref:C2H2-type domain-containing protein n=1 Tax=Armillaria gallica TaxID=47427 RepID=A0A2H3DFB7_ARMGA|nr:hypothetical protein ARMGADRAFT_1062726 [Armillaria gallica]
MVFGLFSRKVQPDKPEDTQKSETNPTQLRTPSPSVESSSVGKAQLNASPASLREPPASPSPPPEGDDADLGLITDPAALHSLISSIPPKTFHEYTLSHLIPPTRSPASSSHVPIYAPSSRTLTHLTSFFSTLTPPPRLHCIRCHKFYFDVENTDRSCVVHHDDESAEVSRVGSTKTKGTEYETLWTCCGKTVEGDGDMGPPDGWCYEGKHTTDLKRARFRADSSIHDDKLTSCEHLRCHDPPPPSDMSSPPSSPRARKKTTRKRPRPADDDQEGAEADQPLDDTQSVISSKGKGKQKAQPSKPRKKRAKTSDDGKTFKPEPVSDNDDMDVDETASTSSKRRKSRPKPRPATKRAIFPTARTPSPTRPAAFAVPASPPLRKSLSPTRSVVSVVVGAAPRSLKESMKSRGRPKVSAKPLTEVVSTSISGEE